MEPSEIIEKLQLIKELYAEYLKNRANIRIPIPYEVKKAAFELIAAGVCRTKIGEYCGISPSTVYKWTKDSLANLESAKDPIKSLFLRPKRLQLVAESVPEIEPFSMALPHSMAKISFISGVTLEIPMCEVNIDFLKNLQFLGA
ncbi:MAG: helix-turn-helix domain-containing protein [Candidatus Magasanikbacteria bacterium]|nr:helix-turn-helix domain-containing protein [Candidatus Magasanikbacteria bacterium]